MVAVSGSLVLLSHKKVGDVKSREDESPFHPGQLCLLVPGVVLTVREAKDSSC